MPTGSGTTEGDVKMNHLIERLSSIMDREDLIESEGLDEYSAAVLAKVKKKNPRAFKKDASLEAHVVRDAKKLRKHGFPEWAAVMYIMTFEGLSPRMPEAKAFMIQKDLMKQFKKTEG